MVHLWVRAESRPNEDRVGITPEGVRDLIRRGFRVTTAEGGAEGIARAEAERFDLVAVDHYMPGIDGLETLARLRALPDGKVVPIVVVTAWPDSSGSDVPSASSCS